MLGYDLQDLQEMMNSVHDAKLFYITKSGVTYVDQDPTVASLLKTQDFLNGLWAEGYFDGYQD